MQAITAQIYITIKPESENPEFLPDYPSPHIRGVEEEEISRLIQIFWGKTTKLSQNRRNEQNQEQEKPKTEENPEEHRKYNILSYPELRVDFLNKNRNAIQRCLLALQLGRDLTVLPFYHPNFCAIDINLSFYDKVRICVFTKIFGISFDFSNSYPHLSRRRILKFIKQLEKSEAIQSLDALGINVDQIQSIIDSYLNENLMLKE